MDDGAAAGEFERLGTIHGLVELLQPIRQHLTVVALVESHVPREVVPLWLAANQVDIYVRTVLRTSVLCKS